MCKIFEYRIHKTRFANANKLKEKMKNVLIISKIHINVLSFLPDCWNIGLLILSVHHHVEQLEIFCISHENMKKPGNLCGNTWQFSMHVLAIYVSICPSGLSLENYPRDVRTFIYVNMSTQLFTEAAVQTNQNLKHFSIYHLDNR